MKSATFNGRMLKGYRKWGDREKGVAGCASISIWWQAHSPGGVFGGK
jgi:hypothetical protein